MKINVLYIIWSLEVGGAERIVISLAKYINKDKYNPIVCCLNHKGGLAEELERLGIKVIELRKKPNIDLSIIPKLIRVIKEHRIQIVHTHLWTADFWGRVAAKLARVPIIISTVHSTDYWKPNLFKLVDKIFSVFTDKIIAISDNVKNCYIKDFRIHPDRILTICNGIELENFSSDQAVKWKKLSELALSGREKVIAIIGRLVELKGHKFFLEMLNILKKDYPDIKGLIIGGGPLKEKLTLKAEELNLQDNVIFTGLRDDVPALLNLVNVLVSSSAYEGMPLVILEAMAAGVPVVTTNVGGMREVIEDGVTGFLVPPDNPSAIAEKVSVLLKDKRTYRKIIECAKYKVEKNYGIKRMLQETESLYDKLLSKKKITGPKIKIVFLIDTLSIGGAERQLVELAKHIDKKRFEIKVICLSTEATDLAKELIDRNIEVKLIKQWGKFCLPAFINLFKLLSKDRPDIVHTYLFTASLYGRLVAKLVGTPFIIASERSTEIWKKKTHIITDRYLAKFTNKILVNAKAIKQTLVNREKILPEKIQIIYNGIDLNRLKLKGNENWRIKRDLNILNGNRVVGIIGRMTKEKGHLDFLKAAKQTVSVIPGINFLIVGNGALKKELEDAAEELRIKDKVIFAGNRQNILEILNVMDILVSSSLYEGCSNVILEAMAAAVPVVATDVGGNPEIIINNQTGILVPPQNPDILAEAILLLLNNPSLGKQMGEKGQQRIREKFLLSHMVEATQKIYEELIGSKKCYA